MLMPFLGPYSVDDVLNKRNVSNRCGVYVIINNRTNRRYVGKADCISERVRQHFLSSGGNGDIYRDYCNNKELGSDGFVIYCVELESTGFRTSVQLESSLILLFDSIYCGYNKNLSERGFSNMQRSAARLSNLQNGVNVIATCGISDDGDNPDYCELLSSYIIDDTDYPMFFGKQSDSTYFEIMDGLASYKKIRYDADFSIGEDGREYQFFNHPTSDALSKLFSGWFYSELENLSDVTPVHKLLVDVDEKRHVYDYDYLSLACFSNLSFENAIKNLMMTYVSFFTYVNERLFGNSLVLDDPLYLPVDVYAVLCWIYNRDNLKLCVPCHICKIATGIGSAYRDYRFCIQSDVSILTLFDVKKRKYSSKTLRSWIKGPVKKQFKRDSRVLDEYVDTVLAYLYECQRYLYCSVDSSKLSNRIVLLKQFCIFFDASSSDFLKKFDIFRNEKKRLTFYVKSDVCELDDFYIYEKHFDEDSWKCTWISQEIDVYRDGWFDSFGEWEERIHKRNNVDIYHVRSVSESVISCNNVLDADMSVKIHKYLD